MKAFFTFCLFFFFVSLATFSQRWSAYPTPKIGDAKYLEYYKDSMILIQNDENLCFVSFDYGQTWQSAMNGFQSEDYPQFISLGKDYNFYAQIRDNVYKYSIQNNQWVWLFGGCNCCDTKIEIDKTGNIYTVCGLYAAPKFARINYRSKTNHTLNYIDKLILGNNVLIAYNQQKSEITFIDTFGLVDKPIQLVTSKNYLYYSDYYSNLYFYGNDHLFIYNLTSLQLDSVLFELPQRSVLRIFETVTHELLFSIGVFDELHSNFSSSDGGFTISKMDTVMNNGKLIKNIHFLSDDNYSISNNAYLFSFLGTKQIVSKFPGETVLPVAFIKSKSIDYYFYKNGMIFSKAINEVEPKLVSIENNFLFNSLSKDKNGVVYLTNSTNKSFYYKLNDVTEWSKIGQPKLNHLIIDYKVDDNGIVYAEDSTEIKYSSDLGKNWNHLMRISGESFIRNYSSVDSIIYILRGTQLSIVNLLNFTTQTQYVPGFIGVNNAHKIAFSMLEEGFLKRVSVYYILDSLTAQARYLSYTEIDDCKKLANSFWHTRNNGIYNFLDTLYYYSFSGLPKNNSGKIVIHDLEIDADGYLYTINDIGIFKNQYKLKGNSTTSVIEINDLTNLYPNPTNNILHLESKRKIKHIEIYSADLRLLQRTLVNSYQFSIDVSSLNSGTYLLKYILDSGELVTQKFLKY